MQNKPSGTPVENILFYFYLKELNRSCAPLTTSTPVKNLNNKCCREEPTSSQFEPSSKRRNDNKSRLKNEMRLSKVHTIFTESPSRRIDRSYVMEMLGTDCKSIATRSVKSVFPTVELDK